MDILLVFVDCILTVAWIFYLSSHGFTLFLDNEKHRNQLVDHGIRLLTKRGDMIDVLEQGMEEMVARNDELKQHEQQQQQQQQQHEEPQPQDCVVPSQGGGEGSMILPYAEEDPTDEPGSSSQITMEQAPSTNNNQKKENNDGEDGDASVATRPTDSASDLSVDRESLYNMGAATAAAIALHNFPEGLVTFVAYVDDPAVGVALAIGIAIHNIPEGLCVTMPIYYASGSPGLSEPLGALVGWIIIKNSLSGNTNGILFGFVGGMMVFICIFELLPMAFKFEPKGSIVGWTCIFGMLVVASSLMLFSI